MTDELERAVERVDVWANYIWTTHDQIAVRSVLSTFTAGDLRLILADRAELLATVGRMRSLLRKCLGDYGHKNFTDRHGMADRPAPAPAGELRESETELCPICAKPLTAGHLSFDVTEGTCHARCLDGSPVVQRDTGEPVAPPGDLRGDILERLRAMDYRAHYSEARYEEFADAILAIIQSERGKG